MTFTEFVLWVHIASIALWSGALAAMVFIVVPISSRSDGGGAAPLIARYRRFARELLALIFLTGIFNIINDGRARSFHYTFEYLAMLSAKVIVFVLVAVLSTVRLKRVAEGRGTIGAGASLVFVGALMLAILLGVLLRYR